MNIIPQRVINHFAKPSTRKTLIKHFTSDVDISTYTDDELLLLSVANIRSADYIPKLTATHDEDNYHKLIYQIMNKKRKRNMGNKIMGIVRRVLGADRVPSKLHNYQRGQWKGYYEVNID